MAPTLLLLIVLTVVAVVSVLTHKLNVVAAVTGWFAGFIVYIGFGFTGVAMMAAFFVLGTLATSYKLNFKQHTGLAEKNKGERNAGQVLANAGVAVLLGILVNINNVNFELYKVMLAASFASATADTLSSEIGNIYGKHFYNIITWKKDIRGLDGVISLEGTIAGVLGSIVIAIIYSTSFGFTRDFLWIVLAGTIGNLFDSIIGATLERKKVFGNNVTNFLNTLIASISAGIIYFGFF